MIETKRFIPRFENIRIQNYKFSLLNMQDECIYVNIYSKYQIHIWGKGGECVSFYMLD